MDLALLVLGSVVGHVFGVPELLERLPETGHIAVPEDPPHAGDEAVLPAVALDVLASHEANDGLTHGQSDSIHRCLLAQPIAETVSSRLVPRQQGRRVQP